MNRIYILSGLGADKRVFQRLELPGFELIHIDWISPQRKETIAAYASRLLEKIEDPNPVLIGLSFGGMVAVEIAKQRKCKQLILISSAKTKTEIPLFYRWAGALRLHYLLPTALLKRSNILVQYLFGCKNKEDRQLLRSILKDTNPVFLRWAIHQIVSWRNEMLPLNYIHIHGSSDHILPASIVTYQYLIPRGGHLMIFNKAEELNPLLQTLISGEVPTTSANGL